MPAHARNSSLSPISSAPPLPLPLPLPSLCTPPTQDSSTSSTTWPHLLKHDTSSTTTSSTTTSSTTAPPQARLPQARPGHTSSSTNIIKHDLATPPQAQLPQARSRLNSSTQTTSATIYSFLSFRSRTTSTSSILNAHLPSSPLQDSRFPLCLASPSGSGSCFSSWSRSRSRLGLCVVLVSVSSWSLSSWSGFRVGRWSWSWSGLGLVLVLVLVSVTCWSWVRLGLVPLCSIPISSRSMSSRARLSSGWVFRNRYAVDPQRPGRSSCLLCSYGRRAGGWPAISCRSTTL
ncbi:hypothetical protein B0H21DRAFT_885671, partial [Amylocystis lapponica]